MKTKRLWTWIAILAVGVPAAGDVLETRDGRALEGMYLGGTQQTVRFKVGENVEVLLVEEVAAVRFGPPTPARGAKAPGTAQAPAQATPRTAPTAAAPAPARPAQAPARTAPTTAARAPASESPPVPAPTGAATAPATRVPAVATRARLPAGTRLHVRLQDGIDARQSAVGDRFAASLETGLGLDGTPVLPAGTKLYGQVAELRATGPVATRLKLELTQLMHQGELIAIVTGSQQPAAEDAAPANASTLPSRPGFPPGAVLEFRLLQPFEISLP